MLSYLKSHTGKTKISKVNKVKKLRKKSKMKRGSKARISATHTHIFSLLESEKLQYFQPKMALYQLQMCQTDSDKQPQTLP